MRLLTVTEVRERTALGRTTVYRLIETGELPAVRIGHALRVREDVLEAWIEARSTVGAA